MNIFKIVLLIVLAFANPAHAFNFASDCSGSSSVTWSAANGFSCDLAGAGYNNSPVRSIVTTASAANGFQLSNISDSSVNYNVSISTTATLAAPAAGYIVLEISATNSINPSDWTEVSRVGNSQSLALLAVQTTQVITGSLNALVPPGYYIRLRSVISSGNSSTVTFSYVSGQEVVL